MVLNVQVVRDVLLHFQMLFDVLVVLHVQVVLHVHVVLHVQMIPIFRGYRWSITNQTNEEIDGINDESLLRTMLNNLYIDKIDNNFIGWPTENLIGGFNIETDILRNRHMPEGNSYPYAVSNIDPHPNALGHTKIAEYLYENLATINLI